MRARCVDDGGRGPFLPLIDVFGDPETGDLLSETGRDQRLARRRVRARRGPGRASGSCRPRRPSRSRRGRSRYGSTMPRSTKARAWSATRSCRSSARWDQMRPRWRQRSIGARPRRTSWTAVWLSSFEVLSRGVETLLIEVGDSAAILADGHRRHRHGRPDARPAGRSDDIRSQGRRVDRRVRSPLRPASRRSASGPPSCPSSERGGTSAALGPQAREVRRLVARSARARRRRRSLAYRARQSG